MKYEVLLFYKYTTIDNPSQVRENQRALCARLGLMGRIIVASNGINGTLEGEQEKTEEYRKVMQQGPRFADISFKKSHCF